MPLIRVNKNKVDINSIDSSNILNNSIIDADISFNANININKINIPNDSISGDKIESLDWNKITNKSITGIDITLSVPQIINKNIWTKIKFDIVNKDILKEYSFDNYKFIATQSGRYLITCAIKTDFNKSNHINFAIYKNGKTTYRENDSNNININLNIATTLDLVIGDYIELYAFQNNFLNSSILPYYTWMTISRLF